MWKLRILGQWRGMFDFLFLVGNHNYRGNLYSWSSPTSIFHCDNWRNKFLQNINWDTKVNLITNRRFLILRQSAQNLWYESWHTGIFISYSFGVLLSVSFYWCSIFSFLSSLVAATPLSKTLMWKKKPENHYLHHQTLTNFTFRSSHPLHSNKPGFIVHFTIHK